MDTYAADFEVGRGWAALSGPGAGCFASDRGSECWGHCRCIV
jgi:hypothetical protein